jgi:Flp pilus assembly pilin Flp
MMLTRFFHRVTQLKWNKFAVTSLEYGMVAMLVAVAAVGTVNSGVHVPATFTQTASAK